MAEGGTATARMARPATRTAPRFPKNESRSRSPTKRFPSNAPRSPRGGSRQRAAGGEAPKSPSRREKLKLERTESAPATPEASQRPKANPNKNKRSNGTNMSASFSQLYVNPLDDDFFLGDPTSPNAAADKSGSKNKPTVNGENFNGSWRPFEDDNNKTDTTTNSKANDAPKSPSRRRERVGAPKSPGRGSKEKVGMTTPKSPGRRKKESSYETPNSPLSESKKPSSPKKGRKGAVDGGGDISQVKPPSLSFDDDDNGFSMLQPPSLDFDEDDAETETKDTKNSPQEESNNHSSPEPEQKLRSIGDIASQMKKENNNEKDHQDDEEEETKKKHSRGERKGRSPPRGDRHQKRAGYRRSMSTGGIEREPSRVLRRGHEQEKEEDDEIPERGPRKPPRGPPPTQRPPPKGHLRGRAESLLNHSLLGDSGNGMDMSMSFSGINTNTENAAAAEAPAPNHQRRRRSSVDNPQRTTSRRTSVGSSRRGQRSKSAGRSRERPVEGGGGRSHSPATKQMRKTKSLPEGDLSPETTTTTDNKSGRGKRSSDGDNRSGRGKRSSDGDNRSGRGKRSSDGDNNRSGRGKRSTDHSNGERRKTSPSSGEGKSSPSPEPVRRRASGSTRRARSRTRPEDQTEQIDKLKGHLKAKNEELGTVKRAVSHSPQRPRTTKFPSNAPRSVSPSARTNHRNRDGDASPEGSRRGRRTGHSSAATRAQSSSPGHEHRRSSPNSSTHQRRASRTSPQQKRSSPNSSSHQRRTSPSRDDEEEPITPEPAHKDHVDLGLAPPSGAPTRQSLSLANVFDMENSITLDGDGNDSSASEATDGGDTVLQFDPASMNSVTSFKRASAAESMSNAGVFKMENLSEKKPREEEDDEDESEGSEDSGGSYLPNAMGMSKSKNHRRRHSAGNRQSSHSPGPRQSSNSPGPQRPQRRESRRKRSPQGGGGDRGGGDRRRPESRQRRESLTLDSVFDQNSASVPNLGHNQKTNGGAMNDNQASFRSHYESDSAREERRRKLQDRLNQRTNNRRDREEEEEEEDSEEDASVYLPSNMTGKSLTPPGSPRRSAASRNGRSPRSSVRQQPRRARSRSSSRQRRPRIDTRTGRRVEDEEEDEDEEEEDMENEGGSPAEENEDEDSDESSEDEDDRAPLQHRESKRKVAMKFIKKNLKSVKHKIQDDLQGSSISSFFESPSEDISVQASEEEDEEYDPYNKKAPKTESKGGVKKKFKGLFAKKKQHQLLGSSGESDSDVSLEMQQGY